MGPFASPHAFYFACVTKKKTAEFRGRVSNYSRLGQNILALFVNELAVITLAWGIDLAQNRSYANASRAFMRLVSSITLLQGKQSSSLSRPLHSI